MQEELVFYVFYLLGYITDTFNTVVPYCHLVVNL